MTLSQMYFKHLIPAYMAETIRVSGKDFLVYLFLTMCVYVLVLVNAYRQFYLTHSVPIDSVYVSFVT